MKRREFIAVLGGAAAWPMVAGGQQPTTRVPLLGWLVTGSPTSYRFSLAAFQDGLRTLGYIDGQNISIEYRWAEGHLTELPELAKDLVDRKVDVILAGGIVGVQAAMHATSVIPIVGAGIGDLVALGLVPSLARPGGNLTGFVVTAPETGAKRFQIMLEIKPEARRAAILRNATSSNANLEWEVVKDFAHTNNITLAPFEAHDLVGLTNTLAAIPQTVPDILVVLSDPLFFTSRKELLRLRSGSGSHPFMDFANLPMMEE